MVVTKTGELQYLHALQYYEWVRQIRDALTELSAMTVITVVSPKARPARNEGLYTEVLHFALLSNGTGQF